MTPFRAVLRRAGRPVAVYVEFPELPTTDRVVHVPTEVEDA